MQLKDIIEMTHLLAEIERELPKATWRASPTPDGLDAHAYEGRTGDWHFVVMDFDIADQGFPPGTRGWDGCARKGATIIGFTRPIAERAFRAAVAYVESPTE